MTSQLIPLVPLDGKMPQVIVTLDVGVHVAMAYSTARTPMNTLAVTMTAWQVQPNGEPVQVDDEDGLVLVEMTHNAPPAQVAELGVAGIVTCLRDMLLDQPLPAVPGIAWSAELRAQKSIRNAIAMANALAGPANLLVG